MSCGSSRNALGVGVVKHQSTATLSSWTCLPSLTLAVLPSLTLAVLPSLTRLIAHHPTLSKLLVTSVAVLLVTKLLVTTVAVLLIAKLLVTAVASVLLVATVAVLLVATVAVLLIPIASPTITAIHLRLGKWAGP